MRINGKDFKRILSLAFVFVTTALHCQPLKSNNNIAASIFKCWQPETYSFMSVSAMGPKEANTIIHKVMCFRNNQAIIFGDTVVNITYKIEKKKTEDAVANLFDDVSINKLGIRDSDLYNVTIVTKVKNNRWNGAQFLYDNNKIYIQLDGVVFTYYQHQRPQSRNSN